MGDKQPQRSERALYRIFAMPSIPQRSFHVRSIDEGAECLLVCMWVQPIRLMMALSAVTDDQIPS